MIKRNKIKLIISSVIILLPVLIGIFGSKILPPETAIHWGLDGKADGWGNPSVIFFVLPLVLLAIHWICMIITAVIDKDAAQNKKVVSITFWIVPVISLMSCGVILSAVLGYTSKMSAIISLILALAFIIIGNYMPKITRNRTMGIKIKWTLSNDENWSATHRFAGKVYVVAGFVCLLAMPLPTVALPFVMIGLILPCILLPVIYSYRFYKKQLTEGKTSKEEYEKGYRDMFKNRKAAIIVTVILVAVVLTVIPVLMFTGNIETTLGDTSLTVKADYWTDITLNYEDIDAIEYREGGVEGQRISGVGSARLLLGIFRNDEFGTYTRYTYTGKKACIVLNVEGKTVVIGTDNDGTTKEIYERISAKISE